MPNLNEALFKIGALEEILEREFELLKEKEFQPVRSASGSARMSF